MITLTVGDIVIARRASGVNEANERAVVVESYDHGWGRGWLLQFERGGIDGFHSSELGTFGIQWLRHEPTLASYRFTNVMQLDRDRHAGLFAAAFRNDA